MKINDSRRLILASGSPARYKLLKQLGVPFEVLVSHIDESRLEGEPIRTMVERLALAKTQAIVDKCDSPSSIIIGCDQMVAVEGNIMGKPYTHDVAMQQLRLCSGKVLDSYTALCVFDRVSNHYYQHVVHCSVHFKELNEEIMEHYITRDKPYQCAGSIRAEGLGVVLFKRIDTEDMTALVGLPLIKLVDTLSIIGFDVLDPQYGECCV